MEGRDAQSTPLPTPTTRSSAGADNTQRAWSPEAASILIKPTGAICNLACSYCFFLDKELLYEGDRFRMSEATLEEYIRQLIAMHRSPHVTVSWQGGEPTLMGLDFYRRAIELQEKYRRPGMTFLNTIQTNGTLLNDEWCEFLREHRFLVGISIDGPRELHDAYRVNKRGDPSFDKVMRGLRLLQKHEIEINVLTTVNRINADYPLEVYSFLRDDVGAEWMQFIPVVERVDQHGEPAHLRGARVSHRSVLAQQYGSFLIAIFDEWVRKDVGDVFVQTFEAVAKRLAGFEQSGVCIFDETCGLALALEHNGDLYSCDHYVDAEFLLGNVSSTTVGEMVSTRQQHEFGRDKIDGLPQYCLECDVRFICNGECPKNRFNETPDGEAGLNYLCAGLKNFFYHVDRPLRLALDLMGRGQPASDVMEILAWEDSEFLDKMSRAGRNGLCPCGSGVKVKKCHGQAKTRQRMRPLPVHPGIPRPPVIETRRSDARCDCEGATAK